MTPLSTTSNSLKELGYTIKAVEEAKNEQDGSQFVFVATPPPFYIKLTKRGKLKAFRNKEDKTETSIQGLYGLELKGDDLVGKRAAPAKPKPVAA